MKIAIKLAMVSLFSEWAVHKRGPCSEALASTSIWTWVWRSCGRFRRQRPMPRRYLRRTASWNVCTWFSRLSARNPLLPLDNHRFGAVSWRHTPKSARRQHPVDIHRLLASSRAKRRRGAVTPAIGTACLLSSLDFFHRGCATWRQYQLLTNGDTDFRGGEKIKKKENRNSVQ